MVCEYEKADGRSIDVMLWLIRPLQPSINLDHVACDPSQAQQGRLVDLPSASNDQGDIYRTSFCRGVSTAFFVQLSLADPVGGEQMAIDDRGVSYRPPGESESRNTLTSKLKVVALTALPRNDD